MTLNLDPAARLLYGMEPLRKPILQKIVTSLHLPEGSQGLDVGCGIGLQTLLLAQAIGPHGHVTGLDNSASFLEVAQAITSQTDFTGRVSFKEGNWHCIPFEDNAFDWVWSMDAAGYAPDDPVSTVQELARVIKPGGRLILGYWSSQCLLPGYPALEARLSATPAGIAPFTVNSLPETHFLHTLGWMRKAGLAQTYAETFVQTVHAPLDADQRKALTDLFAMRWETIEMDVSKEDWQAYLSLCRPASLEFILNDPDYCAFFTYSVYSAVIP